MHLAQSRQGDVAEKQASTAFAIANSHPNVYNFYALRSSWDIWVAVHLGHPGRVN